MAPPRPIAFITRELTAGEQVWQAGWAKRKSGLLDRLDVDGPRITIRRRDGVVDEVRKGEFRCTTYRTRSGRRLFVLKTDDGRKIQFLEMDGMLAPEEWDAIADEVLEATPSNLAAVMARAGLSLIPGMLAAALTTGFLGGLLDLKPEQMKIHSPLCLGLITVWTVAFWFGFRLLRRFR